VSARAFRVLAGCLALSVPALFTIGFGLLQRRGDYPQLLGLDAPQVFARVASGGAPAVRMWALTLTASVLFMALVPALHQLLARDGVPYLGVAATFGLLAGLTQILDLSQWVFLVPRLSAAHGAPGASPAARQALAAVYEGFHGWLGLGVGLSLATIFNGLWALPVGLAMRRWPWTASWLGWGGVVAGAAFLASAVPGLPLRAWFLLNTVGFGAWSLWLAAVGVSLILRRSPGRREEELGA
jgi:uncharacterized protein DUF4386